MLLAEGDGELNVTIRGVQEGINDTVQQQTEGIDLEDAAYVGKHR